MSDTVPNFDTRTAPKPGVVLQDRITSRECAGCPAVVPMTTWQKYCPACKVVVDARQSPGGQHAAPGQGESYARGPMRNGKPLCIDGFCGLGGWAEGFLAEGWDVIGFDIERHDYGTGGYPAQLVIQDVLTLHGSQFRNADCIVASPPCQAYSYMAMPWSRAKAKAAEIRADDSGAKLAQLTALFDACFRIQREACEAAGRHIPMVVENVRGAEPWVGRAAWNYGSFYLWGDVPALMPHAFGRKVAMNFHEHEKTGKPGRSFQSAAVDAVKNGGDWFSSGANCSLQRRASSKSASRKAASAAIAKIPFALASWIARCYRPERAA